MNPVLTTSNAPASPGVIPPLSLQIPTNPNTLGLQLFVQGATLGPAALESLALSNTVRGLVGLP